MRRCPFLISVLRDSASLKRDPVELRDSSSPAQFLLSEPRAALDGFYLERTVNQGGAIPYEQPAITFDGRTFALISWHYAIGREGNPSRDDLASHIAHCRGYFLKRGVR
jgi:hypothetical protein